MTEFDAEELTKIDEVKQRCVSYYADLGDRVFRGFEDFDNPEKNWSETVSKADLEKHEQELKDKVKIGNYYSYDGVEYAQKIETEEDVRNVIEDIEEGLCWDVYTPEELKK